MKELHLKRFMHGEVQHYSAGYDLDAVNLRVRESFGAFAFNLASQLYSDGVHYVNNTHFLGTFNDEAESARTQSKNGERYLLLSLVGLYNNVRGGRNALKSLVENVAFEQKSRWDAADSFSDGRYGSGIVDGLGFLLEKGKVRSCIRKASEFVPGTVIRDLTARMRSAAYYKAGTDHNHHNEHVLFAR
jgi:hypothetical protein